MNWDQVEGKWKEFRGSVREQWGKLTEDDLDVIGGKREQLTGRLQQQYGYSKEKAEDEINAFLKNRHSTAK
ncbi:MAG: CsbD family protein [Bryobacteraceae bacterium]